MDTAMLRIPPPPTSFLTKPPEQLAKNNMTCCLRSGLRPPGEGITGGGGVIQFRTSPALAPVAATNSKHRPQISGAAQEDGETVVGESLYFWTSFLYRLGLRLDGGHFQLFSDTNHIPSQSSREFILHRARLALVG